MRNSEKLPCSLSSQWGHCLSLSGVGKAICFCKEDQFHLSEVFFSPCSGFGFCFPICFFRNASGGCVVMKSKLEAHLNFESCFVCSVYVPFAFTWI